jgi:hypothetical protein
MNDHPFSSLFDDPSAWQVFASGQAIGELTPVENASGKPGLRLNYDFHGGGGFVVIRRVFEFSLPETFAIHFDLRGSGPPNHFEVKVADPGGTNVWRHLRADFTMPDAWTKLVFNERDLPFAWGPAGGGAPSLVQAVEFVIAAGPGGTGFVEFSNPLLEDETPRPPFVIQASSHVSGFTPQAVMDPDSATGWKAKDEDAKPQWSVDFGKPVRFGGLIIEWPEALPPRKYKVESSLDGTSWLTAHQGKAALGLKSHLPTPNSEARHLRITFADARCAALRSLTLKPDAFSRSPNEFIHQVASDFPRGWFPRYWHREQSYWTPVGSPEGKRRALINEEGMVEIDEAGFSLEPFILTESGLVTWSDVSTSPKLPQGGAPVPSVSLEKDGMRLEILPWVDGRGDHLTLHVTYRLHGAKPGERLVITARPFQVNPPWQAFRNLGGRSPIRSIECGESGMTVAGRTLVSSPPPEHAGACTFEEGGVTAFLSDGKLPPQRKIDDSSELGSGAMAWSAGTGRKPMEVTVSVPYFNESTQGSRARALARWNRTLGSVEWQVPACAAPAFDCFRSAAGHILINRDGPAIQPGPRRYTRSWVRDCVIMGAALAKAGLPKPLRIFLTWYAKFQRADGFIPCVVDRDGVDWLVEHDSHGQFLWGIREVLRNDGDARFVKKLFPRIRKAADYLIKLRSQRMTDEYMSGEHAACFGLLPESASHEGYLAHPVHSYWDDFWGVRGLEAAADLAATLGLTDHAEQWRSSAAGLQADLLVSIDKVITYKNLNYIPGSVEWADFDPTATSNAIAQLDFAAALPQGPLHAMLDTYLEGFRRKHRGEMVWNNYTAYEIRIIGAFVRLGRRDDANELLRFFLSDRRPLEWNQWPEITWRDSRSPGHLGDVPHTWIAAEYLLAVASMVACEREADDSLVLASGMPWDWISSDEGFTVNSLPTRFGSLDFHISSDGHEMRVSVGGTLAIPAGGLSISPPLPEGKSWFGKKGCKVLAIHALPYQAILPFG